MLDLMTYLSGVILHRDVFMFCGSVNNHFSQILFVRQNGVESLDLIGRKHNPSRHLFTSFILLYRRYTWESTSASLIFPHCVGVAGFAPCQSVGKDAIYEVLLRFGNPTALQASRPLKLT